MDNEQPHQELVKCVVVGDTAVGKTRLICARACNKHVSLSELLTTHVPTVWAIDQYRIYKDVLERSWEVVDGVNVSLRLWDTFGDHEKDRRFAYGRSDVVLLCFSVTNPMSLKNCLAMWYPEIRRFCPQTPILLVGCKNDLRYLYRDQSYLSYFKDRSPFIRATRKSDLVMPDDARAVARELGVNYYEASVFTNFGVNEVFENAIRAALIARRQQRFWITNLKKVQRPLLQVPYLPPKPSPPEVYVSDSNFDDNWLSMWLSPKYTDVLLIADNVFITAHRFILASASSCFLQLFTTETMELGARSSSDSSVASTLGEATLGEFNDETECLIRTEKKNLRVWDHSKRRSSCQVIGNSHKWGIFRDVKHPAFDSVCVKWCPDDLSRSSTLQTVVRVSSLITPMALNQCLQFIYTGTIAFSTATELLNIRQAADFLELRDLVKLVSHIQLREEFLHNDLRIRFLRTVRDRMKELCVEQGLFSDVMFQLDDGCYTAHRQLLIARCDVMKAMFTGAFRESAAKVVIFPGVGEDTFQSLLTYLYTDDIPAISPARCVDLLELANRLCLPRLVNLIEERVVTELSSLSAEEMIEHCLRILEPSQLHNAHQLKDWCMNHLCANYNILCKHSSKLLRSLLPENQDYLKEHRWPPVWYLKDYDYYEKCLSEREKEDKCSRGRAASGCLCFPSARTAKQTESHEVMLSVASG